MIFWQFRKESNKKAEVVSQLLIRELSGHGFGPVDLEIDHGQCVCLSGASGAGKTVFLRAIVDLDVHQGEAKLDDESSKSMSATTWRTRVGYLPANSGWWHETIDAHFKNIDHVPVKALGFDESFLKKPVDRLSTGELQRFALLRLLENKPEVLLLDEPTASLDPDNVTRVEKLIENYRKNNNAAILWVSHDRDQAKRVSSRNLIMKKGRLTESTP